MEEIAVVRGAVFAKLKRAHTREVASSGWAPWIPVTYELQMNFDRVRVECDTVALGVTGAGLSAETLTNPSTVPPPHTAGALTRFGVPTGKENNANFLYQNVIRLSGSD